MKKNLTRILTALILLTSASNLIALGKPKTHTTHITHGPKKNIICSEIRGPSHGYPYSATKSKCVGNITPKLYCRQCHTGSSSGVCTELAKKAGCWYVYKEDSST